MKENKALALFLFASLLLIVVISAILTTSFLQLSEMKSIEQSLVAQIEQQGGQVDNIEEKPSENSVAKSIEKTGYPPELLEADTRLVTEFFKQAFTWSGDAAYEKARAHYIELLGEQNSFLATYLGKGDKATKKVHTDSEVDRTASAEGVDGEQFTEEADEEKAKSPATITNPAATLSSEIDSVEIIPLRANRDVIHYIGFITYYVGDKTSLENKAELNSETAIVEFSITNTENGRVIDDLEAWSAASREAS